MERFEFHRRLHGFLREANPQSEIDQLGEDENLIDSGYMDSLRMVELILFLERELHVSIPVEDLDPRAFHTSRLLYDSFVTTSPADREQLR